MRILLAILAILAFGAAILVLADAKSAVQEIEGLILVVVFSIFLCGAAVVESLNRIRLSIDPSSRVTSA